MKTLKPVKFSTAQEPTPRISKPYVPGKHDRRFWTDEEKAIVKEWYPKGGCDACLIRLGDHRTASTVYQQAQKLGVAQGRAGQNSWKFTPELDQTIRDRWVEMDGKKRGEVNALADELGLPRWVLSNHARKLGLTIPHPKEPAWTEAEIELLKKVSLDDLDKAAEDFRARGFRRTPSSINNKSKRLRLLRRERRSWLSATAASKILGVDSKWVTAYCISGDLRAAKRDDKRSPQQGGSAWVIQRPDFRQFIIDHLERIDFRKVDKFELVDLLTNTDDPEASDE